MDPASHSHDLDEDSSQNSSLLTCSFNQDGGCLSIGTTSGFSIHNLHPYQKSVDRQLQGGIGVLEMLFRCNLIGIVGGGPSPHAPPNRVLIWDDHVQKAIGELSFRQVVLGVKLRRDAIAVALRDRIYVYHLADLSLRDKIYTADNPHGLLCLSTTAVQDMVVACPSVTEGHVRVELYGMRKTVLMEAHESALRGLALTSDGTKLATASNKGTVIRVWNVASSTCIASFRRGVERVQITCLAWSWDHSFLACTSDKGTAHVFAVSLETGINTTSTSGDKGWFSTMRKSIEGETRKSISQIRGIPHPQACAFLPDPPHTLAVVGWDGRGNGVLSISDFSKEEATRLSYHVVAKASGGIKMHAGVPDPPAAPEQCGKIYIGERVNVLQEGMKEITFQEDNDEGGFVSVTTNSKNEESEDHEEGDAAATKQEQANS
jgi:WD40 repeat protein